MNSNRKRTEVCYVDKDATEWLEWMAKNNVKLQPVLDLVEETEWVASITSLAGDGWTNIVKNGSPQGRGRTPLEALEKLYAKMGK
jgi:hypothetical protein